MRFKDLNQKATKSKWGEWKHLIREIVNEFNDDVFQGRGLIRENSYKEKPYLLLETKDTYLYIFSVPGSALRFSVYNHKIPKEQLELKSPVNVFNEENLIGSFGMGIRGANPRNRKIRKIVF